MSKVVQSFYIGSGRKNAMFTLRYTRQGIENYFDNYVCNLAVDADKAEAKAITYVEAFRDRVGCEDFVIQFDGFETAELTKRRGNLSVDDTRKIETIESGFFPFGKHAGTAIADAPDSYVLFFADKAKDEQNAVSQALTSACLGVALERGLIAKREARRAEVADLLAASEFVGNLAERRTFEGTVFSVQRNENYGDVYYVTKVLCGSDLVVYIGSDLGVTKGDQISFKATVKSHSEYQGVKSTKVNRPKLERI